MPIFLPLHVSYVSFLQSSDPRKNIALVSGREFQIFVAKLRFFLLCPSRTGRISNRARFFFFNDEKLEPPFVNGNIEKSYKFGAVYPQNFTFFQYRLVLGMTHAIRKIRIYGESHRELSQLWRKGTTQTERVGIASLETVPPEWKFSQRWSDNEKLSTQLSISAREKPKRRRLLFSKARRKRRGVFFFSRRQSDVNNLVGG